MTDFISDSYEIDDDNGVQELFLDKYNIPPEWVVRCPGRVNLIGEHIDYNGYSVLPMAIGVSTHLAIGKSTDRQLHFVNASSNYKETKYCVEKAISETELNNPIEWYHYLIAGWRGALESINNITKRPFNAELLNNIHGLNIAVSGNIPPNAGLSSSSALVCAATLSTLAINSSIEEIKTLNLCKLAEIATKSERFIGIESGGMDQACVCVAQENYAMRIDFNPLEFKCIKLPSNALFLVVHSGTEMNKAATSYYNERVVECRVAAQILCKKAGLLDSNSKTILERVRTLKDVAQLFDSNDKDPSIMLQYVEEYLKPANESYTRAEILQILEISDENLTNASLNRDTLNMETFWLTKRAIHVYSEASRVLAFERICGFYKDNCNSNESLNKLADLMNESHSSCRDEFECSCPELDLAVNKCRTAGCLAARLTGAGWGGCVVALVEAANYEIVNEQAKGLNILFWSEPSNGIKAFYLNKD